jgi:hypothetical protein
VPAPLPLGTPPATQEQSPFLPAHLQIVSVIGHNGNEARTARVRFLVGATDGVYYQAEFKHVRSKYRALFDEYVKTLAERPAGW